MLDALVKMWGSALQFCKVVKTLCGFIKTKNARCSLWLIFLPIRWSNCLGILSPQMIRVSYICCAKAMSGTKKGTISPKESNEDAKNDNTLQSASFSLNWSGIEKNRLRKCHSQQATPHREDKNSLSWMKVFLRKPGCSRIVVEDTFDQIEAIFVEDCFKSGEREETLTADRNELTKLTT